jgi:hypothetical protein
MSIYFSEFPIDYEDVEGGDGSGGGGGGGSSTSSSAPFSYRAIAMGKVYNSRMRPSSNR